MTDDDQETCPVPGCDLPYSKRIIDHGPFAVRPDTFKAAKLCVLPIYDEQPGFMHVYHSFDDIASRADAEQLKDHVHHDVAEHVEDGGYEAPGDISEDHAAVFEIVATNENEHGGQSITLGNLRGAAMEADIEKEKVESLALNLVFHGFVDEIENGVFKAPRAAREAALA